MTDHDKSPEDDADPNTDSGEGNAYPGGDADAGPSVPPGAGGYAGRDPAKDMPRMPSAPETQEDSQSHDAAPDDPKPRQASD